MTVRAFMLAAVSAAAFAAPASAQAPAPAAATAQETASQRLHRLFRESDEDSLRRNPIQAMFRGEDTLVGRLLRLAAEPTVGSRSGSGSSRGAPAGDGAPGRERRSAPS